MGEAYTPGLKVKEKYLVKKTRILPILGDILVKLGDKVSEDTVVAKTMLPGEIKTVSVHSELGVGMDEIKEFMLKSEGAKCEKNECIARYRAFFGLINKKCLSPCKGTIERISNETGRVILREPPISLNLKAYIPGEIIKLLPRQGVEICTSAAFIQGIIGIGGETDGELHIISKSPDDILNEQQIINKYKGKIVVGGSLVTLDALKKAVNLGVKGIIVGGIESSDLCQFIGYDIGIAITGHEKVGLTLVITEGFGKIKMAEKTYEILKSHEGQKCCINGATQIRAGVIRPEIIIPLSTIKSERFTKIKSVEEGTTKGLEIGMKIRVIAGPYFGALGKVVNLPIELRNIETESMVRILEIELEDGRKVIMPRANVELFLT